MQLLKRNHFVHLARCFHRFSSIGNETDVKLRFFFFFSFFSTSSSCTKILLWIDVEEWENKIKTNETNSNTKPRWTNLTIGSVFFFFRIFFLSFFDIFFLEFAFDLRRNEKFLAIFRATQPSKVIDIVWWQKEHISIIFLFETEMPFDRKGFQNGLCLYRTDPKTNTEIFICHSIYVWLLWLPKVFGHCITFAVNSMESSSLHSVFLISCFQSIKKQNERRRNQFQFTMHALKQICSAMMMMMMPNDELLHDHENLWRKKQNYINIIMRFC